MLPTKKLVPWIKYHSLMQPRVWLTAFVAMRRYQRLMRWNNDHSGTNKLDPLTDELMRGPSFQQWLNLAHSFIATGEWIINGDMPYGN